MVENFGHTCHSSFEAVWECMKPWVLSMESRRRHGITIAGSWLLKGSRQHPGKHETRTSRKNPSVVFSNYLIVVLRVLPARN
jgi:hypothetical protein